MRNFQVVEERDGSFSVVFHHDFLKGTHSYVSNQIYKIYEDALKEIDRWEYSGCVPIIDGKNWFLFNTDCSCPFHK